MTNLRLLYGISLTKLVTMAFEASVLENGQWTTRMLDVNAVLRHYNQQDQEASENAVEIEKAPVLGLLTQTVIRSPMVHWILPVKLRDLETNHVAFIGVRTVSYCPQKSFCGRVFPLKLFDFNSCLELGLQRSRVTKFGSSVLVHCFNAKDADCSRIVSFKSKS